MHSTVGAHDVLDCAVVRSSALLRKACVRSSGPGFAFGRKRPWRQVRLVVSALLKSPSEVVRDVRARLLVLAVVVALIAVLDHGAKGRSIGELPITELLLVFVVIVGVGSLAFWSSRRWVLQTTARYVSPGSEQFLNCRPRKFFGLDNGVLFAHYFAQGTFFTHQAPQFASHDAPRLDLSDCVHVAQLDVDPTRCASLNFVVLGADPWKSSQVQSVVPERLDVLETSEGALLVFYKSVDGIVWIPFCRVMPSIEDAMAEAAKFGTRVESDQ